MDSERIVLIAIPFHGVRRRGTTEKAIFSLMNMNSGVALVEEHFGTKHLYPRTKIRNCNCIYNFWRPSHMRGGFLFPDIRVGSLLERFFGGALLFYFKTYVAARLVSKLRGFS